MDSGWRLAVDIGGTFTDLVLACESASHSTKVLTTADSPEVGVLEGVAQILSEAGVAPRDITLAIHGTTLATNALIERKGANVALITTEGFRDSVEMAFEHRFEQYDLYMERPEPLVPRYQRHTVTERVAADGEVLLALDERSLEAIAPIIREQQIESIAVCFLHSYVNSEHEKIAGEWLAREFPDLSVTLSSEVCPEIREYERMSTACANAYVQPLMAGYLQRLESGLRDLGLSAPLLLIMSSGGMTTIDTAVAEPIRLVESGPAGGVILAQHIAAELGVEQALSFDMGGTTAKLTLIDDCRPQYSRSFEVARHYRFLKGSGLPIRVPVIDMVEIGAGGGSIGRLDELRRITVGPDSAGASPGPACYGLGGEQPTVTDADVVLGRIEPSQFAGGHITLEPASAATAIDKELANPLGIDTLVAAAGVAEIVNETMASAARVHAVENGKDTTERALIATGGAAPLHAARLADKLGTDTVIVPSGAGVGSAFGFLRAAISYEVVRTRLTRLDAFEPQTPNRLFAQMHAEAAAVVRLGAPDADLEERREAFMRYRGQGHEITVALPNRDFTAGDGDELRRLFEAQYELVFGRIIPGLEIEALTWALTLSTGGELPARSSAVEATDFVLDSGVTRRDVFDPATETTVSAALLERADLRPGNRVAGPVVITEPQTATIVPPAFTATVMSSGHLLLERKG